MKGLRFRIFLVGLVSGIVGLFVSRFYARTVAEDLATRFGAGAASQIMDHGEATRCAADPSAWTFTVPGSVRTFAYDATSLASANRDAPPIDRVLAARAAAPSGVAVRLGDAFGGGALVVRRGGSGPCAILQATWQRIGTRGGGLRIYLAIVTLAGGASMLLAYALAIRPLALRVASVRRSAARVGGTDGYTSADVSTDDDLGKLARELDRAHARIRQDAEQLLAEHSALEEHLANVAHDLRTPIASLQLALEHAITANVDSALVESLKRALEDTVYLSGLTENLRLETRLATSWDEAEALRVDLRDVALRVAIRLKFFAAQHEVALEVAVPDDPVVVVCHAVAVEQAIANIVENAVALGVADGHVAVVLHGVPDGRFMLTVVDDGPGVRMSELPRLGERTFRSDEARRRQPAGSGLGLAITTEVCRRSEWELAFAHEEPQGLRVTITGKTAPTPEEGS